MFLFQLQYSQLWELVAHYNNYVPTKHYQHNNNNNNNYLLTVYSWKQYLQSIYVLYDTRGQWNPEKNENSLKRSKQ